MRWRALCLLAMAMFASSAEAQQFKVVNGDFSRLAQKDHTILDRPQNGTLSRAKLSAAGKLFYSFTVLGDEATCRRLREDEQLEIQVDLFKGLRLIQTYHLDISQERWEEIGPDIERRCAAEQMFTYRTRLFTRQIELARFTAHVRDQAGTTIHSQSVTIVP